MKDQDDREMQQLTWKISPLLHKEIETHLEAVQNLKNEKITKQDWILEAIQEKLKTKPSSFKNEDRICINIDLLTKTNLEECVSKLKKHQGKYSKRQLIVDAIKEKLNTDEHSIKRKYSNHRLLLEKLR